MQHFISWCMRNSAILSRTLLLFGSGFQLLQLLSNHPNSWLILPGLLWYCVLPFAYIPMMLMNGDDENALFTTLGTLFSMLFSTLLASSIPDANMQIFGLLSAPSIFLFSMQIHAFNNYRRGLRHVSAWGEDSAEKVYRTIHVHIRLADRFILRALRPNPNFSNEQKPHWDPPFQWMKWF